MQKNVHCTLLMKLPRQVIAVEEQSELFLPPFLHPNQVAIDGLTFIGLCLTRRSEEGHSQSMTMQTAFDFNEVQDRTYKYIATTNDDGWLLGGGEPSDSPKLPAKDSGHIEIRGWEPSMLLWEGFPSSTSTTSS